MDVGEIEAMVSRAIANLELAKLRLVKSLDICYPRLVGAAAREEIRNINLDLVKAHDEILAAKDLTMDVIEKWGNFTAE